MCFPFIFVKKIIVIVHRSPDKSRRGQEDAKSAKLAKKKRVLTQSRRERKGKKRLLSSFLCFHSDLCGFAWLTFCPKAVIPACFSVFARASLAGIWDKRAF
jgi:hypothetical protein